MRHALPHDHGPEVADDAPHRFPGGVERQLDLPGQSPCRRKLHQELQNSADEGRPGEGDDERLPTGLPGNEQPDDLREVPDDGRREGKEEAAMAVEHPQARHQAARIMNPAIGNRMRTSQVVSATDSAGQPGTSRRVSQGASRMPRPLRPAARKTSRPRILPASRRASEPAPRPNRPL